MIDKDFVLMIYSTTINIAIFLFLLFSNFSDKSIQSWAILPLILLYSVSLFNLYAYRKPNDNIR